MQQLWQPKSIGLPTIITLASIVYSILVWDSESAFLVLVWDLTIVESMPLLAIRPTALLPGLTVKYHWVQQQTSPDFPLSQWWNVSFGSAIVHRERPTIDNRSKVKVDCLDGIEP